MTLLEVQQEVSDHLDDIKKLFKPGAKIMIMIRFPDDGEKDFLMGDDDPQEAMNLLARRMAAGLQS